MMLSEVSKNLNNHCSMSANIAMLMTNNIEMPMNRAGTWATSKDKNLSRKVSKPQLHHSFSGIWDSGLADRLENSLAVKLRRMAVAITKQNSRYAQPATISVMDTRLVSTMAGKSVTIKDSTLVLKKGKCKEFSLPHSLLKFSTWDSGLEKKLENSSATKLV